MPWPFQKNKSNNLVRWLDEADEALIRAYELRDVTQLSNFAVKEVLHTLEDDVYLNKKLFGTKAYRIRSWDISEIGADSYVITKHLTHKHVRLSRNIIMAIADDITEKWKVAYTESGFRIMDIKEVVL